VPNYPLSFVTQNKANFPACGCKTLYVCLALSGEGERVLWHFSGCSKIGTKDYIMLLSSRSNGWRMCIGSWQVPHNEAPKLTGTTALAMALEWVGRWPFLDIVRRPCCDQGTSRPSINVTQYLIMCLSWECIFHQLSCNLLQKWCFSCYKTFIMWF